MHDGRFSRCCGYEDADDLDDLRSDPAFKLVAERLARCIPDRRDRRASPTRSPT
jgi:hypothetical protein